MTFLLATLVLLFMYLQEPSTDLVDGPGSVQYNQINQYRLEAERKIELERGMAEMKRKKSGPKLVPVEAQDVEPLKILPDRDPHMDDLEEDKTYGPVTLDQKMNAFLANRQAYEEVEHANRQAYVDEFKKEARAMGYEVEINDQMEIVKVRKINGN
ncbi:MAG: hypothetical protein KDD33_13755 [Bdellovibrionales bacterium]|nr:hypothetical protein [Bdellovibrionales bacterium]